MYFMHPPGSGSESGPQYSESSAISSDWSGQRLVDDDIYINQTSSAKQEESTHTTKNDFTSLISIISWLYSRRAYLPFDLIDVNQHEANYTPVGEGATFHVTTTTVSRDLPSTHRHGASERSQAQVIIKQPRRDGDLFENNGDLFKDSGEIFDHHGVCQEGKEVMLGSLLMELLILDANGIYGSENIIQLVGVGWYHSQFTPSPTVQPRIVLERADDTLKGHLSKHKTSWVFRTRICLDIARGLETLHANHIIHGDLSLNNLLLIRKPYTDAGIDTYKVKIADFGHSFIQGTRARPWPGTPDYVAPEVSDQKAMKDARPIDLWSFGIVIFKVLIKSDDFMEPETLDSLLLKIQLPLESHANEPRTALVKELLHTMLHPQPHQRDLSRAIKLLQALHLRACEESNIESTMSMPSDLMGDNSNPGTPHLQAPGSPKDMPETTQRLSKTVLIDYTSLDSTSGVVHDQMLRSLARIADDPSDVRRPRAILELAVCKMSRFGDTDSLISENASSLLVKAAQAGDLTAKAYCKKLVTALEETKALEILGNCPVDEWIKDAASHGYETAYEEYLERLPRVENGIDEIMRKRTVAMYPGAEFLTTIDQFIRDSREGNDTFRLTALHWAARLGQIDYLHYLLEELNVPVDAQDSMGITPLSAAFEVGNIVSAKFLIKLGAQFDIPNLFGETALHHIWRFSDRDASALINLVAMRSDFEKAFWTECQSVRASPDGHVRRATGPAELDPLPLLSGIPIERIAGRGRYKLLETMLEAGPAFSAENGHPPSGNTVRRMILWSSRLSFHEVRRYLKASVGDPLLVQTETVTKADFLEMEDTEWCYENSDLDYMSGVAQGWVGSRNSGWRTPELFWRMCLHGADWKDNMRKTMKSMMDGNRVVPICEFDRALSHALSKRRIEFIGLFFEMYKSCHTAFGQGLNGHECTRYVDETGVSNEQGPPSNGLQALYLEPGAPDGGFDHFLPRTNRNNSNPGNGSPWIDRIMFNNDYTLLQRAIKAGDRNLFSLLIQMFDDDPSYNPPLCRPWSSNPVFPLRVSPIKRRGFGNPVKLPLFYLNCYSFLAISNKDLWFAQQFRKLGVPHNHLGSVRERYQRVKRRSKKSLGGNKADVFELQHLTPLYFAIDTGFLHLARFLLEGGASLKDRVNFHSNVLDMVLHPLSIRRQTLQFLFQHKGKYTTLDGVEQQISPELLPEDVFERGKGIRVFALVRTAICVPYSPRLIDVIRFVFFQGFFRDLRLASTLILLLSAYLSEIIRLVSVMWTGGLGLWERSGHSGHALAHRYPTFKFQADYFKSCERAVRSEAMVSLVLNMWDCLVAMFPRVEHRGIRGTPSLLCLAAGIRKRVPSRQLADMPLGYPGMTYASPQMWDHSDILLSDKTMWEIFYRATRYITGSTKSTFEPTLYEAIVANDFDLVDSNTPDAIEMYNLGYRHAALFFFEVHMCITLFITLIAAVPITLVMYNYGFWYTIRVLASSFGWPILLFFYVIAPAFDPLFSILPDIVVPFVSLILIVPIVLFLMPFCPIVPGQIALFVVEILVVRPWVRYKKGNLLLPLLRHGTQVTFTKQEYYAALKRSVHPALTVMAEKIGSSWHWPRTQQARSDFEISEEDEQSRQRQQRKDRRDAVWRKCKDGTKWIYRRILRPSFIYAVIRPTQWTIELAQWEANVARRLEERRLRRARQLAESDDELGGRELLIEL